MRERREERKWDLGMEGRVERIVRLHLKKGGTKGVRGEGTSPGDWVVIGYYCDRDR